MKLFTKFANDESGAVTVDWVVLTAAIVGIAIAVITLISQGVETASEGINTELSTASAINFDNNS
jgi:Flp pilus assembly pilin Flp